MALLASILSLVDPVLRTTTGEAASRAFYHALSHLGVTYLQTRDYLRPSGVLTSASHWAAGGLVTRICRGGWVDSPAFTYICFTCNPLLGAVREGRTRYRFSDFAPFHAPEYGDYWTALGEAGIADALCAASYGEHGRVTSLHLGFGRRDFAPEEAKAVQMAGLMLTEHIASLSPAPERREPTLTGRELDALRFVAEGKSDWELATILGVSEHTARFHVDNARRKLGAVNRAQAVARLAIQGRL